MFLPQLSHFTSTNKLASSLSTVFVVVSLPRHPLFSPSRRIFSLFRIVCHLPSLLQTYATGMLRAKTGTIWSESVMPTLQAQGAIGSALELQCARHEVTYTMNIRSTIPCLLCVSTVTYALASSLSFFEFCKDTVTTITKPTEFDSLAGDGGCRRACSFRLPCGHSCVRR